MYSEEKLKPCPCCGGEAKEESTHGEWEGYRLKTVYCRICSVSAKREDWNKRVI